MGIDVVLLIGDADELVAVEFPGHVERRFVGCEA
jgi:hypothetical protein